MALASKASAGYVDDAAHAPRVDFDDDCEHCTHFIPTDRGGQCTHVAGDINPSGWCEWYEESELGPDLD